MRVVAGTAGGRRLQSPASTRTRPTTDRVREAIFNSLESFDHVAGASVVDLFAGTGACGIEALSRGASSATFVDDDRKAAGVIKRNLQDLELDEAATIVTADVFSFLDRKQHFELAIIDPPYKFPKWAQLLQQVNADVVVCEAEREVEAGPRWKVLRSRKHGETHVTILQFNEREESL